MPRDLRNRSIIITGAGSGIGAATAIACARAGMDVVLCGRRIDRLERVAARVHDAGRRAIVRSGDVTEPGLSTRLLDAAEEELGRLDVIFANAGQALTKPVVDMSTEELRRLFDVNFFAAVDLLQAAARRLRERDRAGHLLMCSSVAARIALPLYGAYASTKAAQSAVCRAMRLEHEGHGIDVSSVHPVTTRTELFATAGDAGANTHELPAHAVPLFTHAPERVARGVVRCLQRPAPEVWTSHLVRMVAGFMTMSPRFGDWSIRRQMAAEQQAYAARATADTTRNGPG
ncbi:MAG: SDR family NAD(P)-dependent oxidoreductase [Phycisphaerales bacterium]|nr:SDR family NAD(P)-dependent oxidoreductase [Phycisphaerae bacterium]NNF43257.1 SDR family NAD(P)-dependent oxidoreductase [Phycisphaerales bacterium]NNM26719.1 SDR family NAD(P)-dependent oxidoreductase [Phycisphaerales bacterium]